MVKNLWLLPVFIVTIASTLLLPIGAETVTSAEVSLQTQVLIDETGPRSDAQTAANPVGNSGALSLKIDSSKEDAVKASIQLSVESTGTVTINRAYIKTRFPWIIEDTSLRCIAGKAPLAWGKGFLFNAGDLVFGPFPTSTTLSNNAYRTATDWMATIYVPIASWSFAELVYLPPIADIPPTVPPTTGTTEKNRSGGRLYFTPDTALLQSVEGGYFLEEGLKHSFYISFDGSLYFDYYASASILLTPDLGDFLADADYSVSFGIFRMFNFIPEIPLSIRAEGLAYPGSNRQLWYPSIQAGLTDSIQLSVQGLFATGTPVNPTVITASAYLEPDSLFIGLVCTWTPLKAFTLSATLLKSVEKGDFLTPDVTLGAGAVYAF